MNKQDLIREAAVSADSQVIMRRVTRLPRGQNLRVKMPSSHSCSWGAIEPVFTSTILRQTAPGSKISSKLMLFRRTPSA
jgi:hypothetical protein